MATAPGPVGTTEAGPAGSTAAAPDRPRTTPAPGRPARAGGRVTPQAAPVTINRTGFRLVFLVPGAVALLLGLDSALSLLGLPAVLGPALDLVRLPDVHGPLMVLGFVGTVIALERAVALGREWGYAAPALSGLGALALASPLPLSVGQGLLVAAQVLVLLVYRQLYARQPAHAVTIQLLGAVMALGAALLWLGGVAVPHLVPWLAGFLVLTIFGERLDLARIESLASGALAAPVAVGIAAALVTSAVVALLAPQAGFTLTGLSLLAVAGWLGLKDIARYTVHASGLPRYVALALLAGYVWLAVAGGIWALGGAVTAGRGYDAVLHAVMLGFVISMIMAHAPVIFPAVLRRPLPFHPVMYAPLVLLHASLVLRLAVGDAHDQPWAVQAGGLLNIVAVLAFVAVAAWAVLVPRPHPAAPGRS